MSKISSKSRYRRLDSDKTLQTIELLNRRIAERFPASGLSSVGAARSGKNHDPEQA
jgi:hypothetical protein